MATPTRPQSPRGRSDYAWQTRHALTRGFPAGAVTAYRYNSAAVHARVIDPVFRSKSISQREKLALPLVREVPEDVQADLTVLLLPAPDETPGSITSAQFDRRTRFGD